MWASGAGLDAKRGKGMFIYSTNTYGHLPLKWPELSLVSEGGTVESPDHCLLCLAFPPLEEWSWEY